MDGYAAREARSASRDPRLQRPNLWMQLGHDKVAAADFWRSRGIGSAWEWIGEGLAVIGYVARDGSARGKDEWIFGVRSWIRRRRRRLFSREVDLALAEARVVSLLDFWEEGNSAQAEALDFERSYYLLLAIFGAGCFWRADLSLADAAN